MAQRVEIKVLFGLMMIDRRRYLLLAGLSFFALSVVTLALYTVFAPGTEIGTIIVEWFPWFFDAFPWILAVTCLLELAEMAFVLRKFREREEFLRREGCSVEAPAAERGAD